MKTDIEIAQSASMLPIGEIARTLGLHKDTVRGHYRDGIKKLQEFFAKYPAKP